MIVIGHGIDLTETARVGRMVDEHGERFMHRCFTEAERGYAEKVKADGRRSQYLAGRFAAKEAVLKALGTGWRDGIAWTDVEVLREPSGRPSVALHGKCLEIASAMGIARWQISISHTADFAMASAVGMGNP